MLSVEFEGAQKHVPGPPLTAHDQVFQQHTGRIGGPLAVTVEGALGFSVVRDMAMQGIENI